MAAGGTRHGRVLRSRWGPFARVVKFGALSLGGPERLCGPLRGFRGRSRWTTERAAQKYTWILLQSARG